MLSCHLSWVVLVGIEIVSGSILAGFSSLLLHANGWGGAWECQAYSCTSVSNLLPAPFWTVSIYEQCRCTEAVHAKVQSFMVDFHGGKVAISRLLYLLWYTCLSRRTEIVLFSSFKVKCHDTLVFQSWWHNYVFVAANTCIGFIVTCVDDILSMCIVAGKFMHVW